MDRPSPRSAPPLECPVCRAALTRRDAAFTCANGHSFDVAKEGYVNLLPAQHAPRGLHGDVAEMLHARRRFLDAGHYAPLREALAAEVDAALAGDGGTGASAVLEAGCGEGYYVGGLAERLAGRAGAFLGTDLSKAAVRLAARRYRDVLFFVSDVHRSLYVEDASVRVLLDVFAPRDAGEFARVVAPGGVAVVAVPGAAHLSGPRERFGLLDVEADKERRVVERLAPAFSLLGRRELRYALELPPDAVRDLVAMGPSSWHVPVPEVDAPVTAEAHFVVLSFERRGR